MGEALAEKAKKIKLVLLDVDGVMTDGTITIDSRGGESRSFDVKDGHGVKLLQRAGVQVGIISGRDSPVVIRRAKELGITIVEQRALNKAEAYGKILKKHALTDEEVAYIGDDVVDLPVLRRVGLSAAVADAVEEVKKEVHYITGRPAGKGAIRELAEFILKAQGKWASVMEKYYRE